MRRTERDGNTIRTYWNDQLVQEMTFPEGVEVIEQDGQFVGLKFPERDTQPHPIEPLQ